MYKIKLWLTHLVRSFITNKFRHYPWPRRLHSRMFDFSALYSDSKDEYKKRVNIGAGPYFKSPGWSSADFLPNFVTNDPSLIHVDLSKSPDQLPFSNLEAIYISHTLEHFHIDITRRLIKSMYNSLKSGGYLRIVVPDASLILDRTRANDLDFFQIYDSYFKDWKNENISITDYSLLFLSANYCRFSRNEKFDKQDEYDKFKSMIEDSSVGDEKIISHLNNHDFEQDETGSYHLSTYSGDLMIKLLKEAGFKTQYRSAFMQSRYSPMREVPLFDGTHPWVSLYVEAIK